MRWPIRILGGLFFVILAVSGVAAALNDGRDEFRPKLPKEVVEGLASSSLTLYSLEPWGGPDIPQWDFHGHHVLGHFDLSPDQSKRAIGALNDALAAGNANMMSACLINPRHALAFKVREDTY